MKGDTQMNLDDVLKRKSVLGLNLHQEANQMENQLMDLLLGKITKESFIRERGIAPYMVTDYTTEFVALYRQTRSVYEVYIKRVIDMMDFPYDEVNEKKRVLTQTLTTLDTRHFSKCDAKDIEQFHALVAKYDQYEVVSNNKLHHNNYTRAYFPLEREASYLEEDLVRFEYVKTRHNMDIMRQIASKYLVSIDSVHNTFKRYHTLLFNACVILAWNEIIILEITNDPDVKMTKKFAEILLKNHFSEKLTVDEYRYIRSMLITGPLPNTPVVQDTDEFDTDRLYLEKV